MSGANVFLFVLVVLLLALLLPLPVLFFFAPHNTTQVDAPVRDCLEWMADKALQKSQFERLIVVPITELYRHVYQHGKGDFVVSDEMFRQAKIEVEGPYDKHKGKEKRPVHEWVILTRDN